MISQTAEYALRAVVWLAHGEGARTSSEIAEATRVPGGYLAKVLQVLARSGLVTSRRGVRGGFALARPAEEITVLDVINAVDPIRRIRECPLGPDYQGLELCPLHERLQQAVATAERAFGETPITEMIRGASRTVPLCKPQRTRGARPKPAPRRTKTGRT